MHVYNPFATVWFWLLIISIIGIITGLILFEIFRLKTDTHWWIWTILGISISLFVISFIWFIVSMSNHYKKLEIEEACGEYPGKKKIKCPPKEKCVEKKIKECTDEYGNIINKEYLDNTERKSAYESDRIERRDFQHEKLSRLPTIEEMRRNTTYDKPQAFSSASIKPLNNLQPFDAMPATYRS